ncbi:MAG: hypothetical protein ACTHN0_06950, partial [Aquihabitans sp.]
MLRSSHAAPSGARSLRLRRASRLLGAAGVTALVIGGAGLVGSPASATTNWSPAGSCGAVDTVVVPPDVYSITVTVAGGSGGRSGSQASSATVAGGLGGQVIATFPVTPGQTLSAVVGCSGANGGSFANTTAAA